MVYDMAQKILVVDDEEGIVLLLKDYFELQGYEVITAGGGMEALDRISCDPDMIILDINMPDLDGLNLSRMVPPGTRVIFTTAFKEYAFDSYEVNALDFLLKPIRYHKFLGAAEKARQWFEMSSVKEERGSLFVRVDSQLRQVEISRILYVTGLKDYVMIYLEGEARPLITHVTMKAMEEMLSTGRFMRVHRSYIVALDKIRSVDRNNCVYIGKEIIHVTDAYKEAFNAYLKAAQPS